MIEYKLNIHPELKSTNEYAKEHLPLDEGLVIQALAQTGGKGRQGRIWESSPGNLYMSLVLKPTDLYQKLGKISLLIGLSVAQALQKFGVRDISVKWPNDVLVKGKKIAGILLEVEQDHLICGVGVNVQNAPIGTAFIGVNADVNAFRDVFVACFNDNYMHFNKFGFTAIQQAWLEKAWKLGKTITVQQQERAQTGTFKGIDDQARLLLETRDQDVIKIQTGDVFI